VKQQNKYTVKRCVQLEQYNQNINYCGMKLCQEEEIVSVFTLTVILRPHGLS